MPGPIANISRILELLPVLALVQRIAGAQNVESRAHAAVELLRFLAAKTDTPLDDEFLAKLEPALRTSEGMALLVWLSQTVASVVEGERIARESGIRPF